MDVPRVQIPFPPEQMFITTLQKFRFLPSQEKGLGCQVPGCALYTFWSDEYCSPVPGTGQKNRFGFWGQPHPSQANGTTEKCKDLSVLAGFGSGLLSNEAACLESPLTLTFLRHDGAASKCKASEKLPARVVQLSSLLESKDGIFGRGKKKKKKQHHANYSQKKSGVNFDISRFLQ